MASAIGCAELPVQDGELVAQRQDLPGKDKR
jgi:hypothetical protein